jgi:carbon monoxide dehydrogenase subunit G
LDLTHTFSVPTDVDETWEHFNDIASVAECFPGATVSSVEGDTFTGSCKVKLGPIALVYNGSGTFVEKDEAAHRFVVEAKGKDKRGNGTAGANVTVSMADASGATDVEVVTDLSVTGKPAQFGRGVMQDVSDKLLGQFVACLETRLAGSGGEPAGDGQPAEGAEPAPPAQPPSGAQSPEVAPEPSGPEFPPDPLAPEPGRSDPARSEPAAATPRRTSSAPQRDDAIDLGATVLPVLVKTYWKQGLGVLIVVALVIWWIARG